MTKILITGGLGYMGVLLANYLVEQSRATGSDTPQIDLADISRDTPTRKMLRQDHLVIVGDLAEEDVAAVIRREDYDIVFHLGGVGSAKCEQYPVLGERNLDATRNILNAVAYHYDGNRKRKVVFASSLLAVEGIETVLDDMPSNAERPYGRSKRISEVLGIGYAASVDFRALRLSTVIGNRDASTASTAFYFGLPILLLRGKDCNVPVPRDFVHPLIWIDDAISGIVKLGELPEADLVDAHDREYRVFNVPSHSVTAEQWAGMVEAYRDRCPGMGQVTWNHDELAWRILQNAGRYMRADRAIEKGIFPATTTTPQQMVEKIYQTVLAEQRH